MGRAGGVAGLGCRVLASPPASVSAYTRCGLHSQQPGRWMSIRWPVDLMRSRLRSRPTEGAETRSAVGTSMATLQEHLRGLGQAASALGRAGEQPLPISATFSFRSKAGIRPQPTEAICKRSFSLSPQANVGSEAADMPMGPQPAAGQSRISQLLIAEQRTPEATSSCLALVLCCLA